MEIHTPGNLKLPASVLTIGALDGVHRGHQKLLTKAKERADKYEVPFIVYTFDPPPKAFFSGCSVLSTLEEKLERIELMGADYVIVGKFDEDFAQKEASMFVEEIKSMNPLEILEGPNFLFGKDRKGTIEYLRQYFDVEIVEPLKCEENKMISSSRIRKLIKLGEDIKAKRLLGEEILPSQTLETGRVQVI